MLERIACWKVHQRLVRGAKLFMMFAITSNSTDATHPSDTFIVTVERDAILRKTNDYAPLFLSPSINPKLTSQADKPAELTNLCMSLHVEQIRAYLSVSLGQMADQ